MAVVLQTNAYLYGFHFDSPPRSGEYADALKDFITRKSGDVSNGVRLYGCCHHVNRNSNRNPRSTNADTAWRDEMKLIAQRLGYTGRITGFDTAIIDPRKGTYIEFRRVRGSDKCRIFYKRHEKMDHTVNTIGSKNHTAPGSGNVNTWKPGSWGKSGGWISNRSMTTSAKLASHATTMHELNYFLRATSFTV